MNPNYDRVEAMLDKALASLGIPLDQAKVKDQPYTWELLRGEAPVGIFLRESDTYKGKETCVVIAAILMVAPTERQAQFELAQTLLSINHSLISEHFSLSDDFRVWLSTARPVAGMESHEFIDLLSNLGNCIDVFRPELVQRFGQSAAGAAPHEADDEA